MKPSNSLFKVAEKTAWQKTLDLEKNHKRKTLNLNLSICREKKKKRFSFFEKDKKVDDDVEEMNEPKSQPVIQPVEQVYPYFLFRFHSGCGLCYIF